MSQIINILVLYEIKQDFYCLVKGGWEYILLNTGLD